MKAVLRCRFRSLESKKVATARTQNPQGTTTTEPKEELIVQERDVSMSAEFFFRTKTASYGLFLLFSYRAIN